MKRNKDENIKSKTDLFELEKEKIYLSKEEKENFAFAEKRHKENARVLNNIVTFFKTPYYVFYKFPRFLIKKITYKSVREAQEKEIKRLKLVMESKERARNSNILKEFEYEKAFETINFKDNSGKYPIFQSIETSDYKESIVFKSNIPLSNWIAKKEQLETALNTNIARIIQGENKQLTTIEIINNTIPEFLEWDNKYLVSDGIFNIGMDIITGELITIDFNVNANLLVGGMPGTGKTKLIQLIIFQCLKYECNVYIGDFKGGVDTIRFTNKCTVITKHTDLLNLLVQFRKEINKRQKLFIEVGAENLREYNEITGKNLKREYLVIDELGEAMEIFDINGMTEKDIKDLKKDIENNLKSIARLGRAFGLNLICGTQRPDVGILEGQTRDQFGGRVCFKALHTTSNIVLNSKIASEIDNIKGRGIVLNGTDYIETQVFFWDKKTLEEIPNKKLTKNDLKIVGNQKENTLDEKDIPTIDFDID